MSLVVVVGIRFSPIKVPGALVLVVGGLMASVAFDFDDRGIALVGDVPRGFVAPSFPTSASSSTISPRSGPPRVGLLLIGFSQTAGDARSFASKHRYRIDIDQESVAQSMSNLGSGVLQGIPVSTSLSASSLNDESGAKTPLASLTTGVLIVLTLLVLAPLFSDLPKPVLAALIIDAVVFGMMDVARDEAAPPGRPGRLLDRHRRDRRRADGRGARRRDHRRGAVARLAGVHQRQPADARSSVARPGRRCSAAVEKHPDSETYPGLLVLRFDAGLFFASADALDGPAARARRGRRSAATTRS